MLEPEASEIERIWNLLPHPEGTVTRVFARNRDTGALDGDFARSWREMLHFARANVDKQVYVCPNPATSTGGVRHSATDVSHWSYLLLDMDPIEDMFDAEKALEAALLALGEWMGKDFKARRPLIIDSGRGRQAWIRLHDIVLNDACEPGLHWPNGYEMDEQWCSRSTARRVNGYWLSKLSEHLGLIHGCSLDTSTSDLPRPMRMPGTFNQKTGRMARVVDRGDGIFGGLATLLACGVPSDKLIDPPVVTLRKGTPWQKARHKLTLTAKGYLDKGQEEPGRHKIMWHTAKKLHELGVDRSEARKALRHANKLRGEKQSLTAEEVEHALDTAYGEE